MHKGQNYQLPYVHSLVEKLRPLDGTYKLAA